MRAAPAAHSLPFARIPASFAALSWSSYLKQENIDTFLQLRVLYDPSYSVLEARPFVLSRSKFSMLLRALRPQSIRAVTREPRNKNLAASHFLLRGPRAPTHLKPASEVGSTNR